MAKEMLRQPYRFAHESEGFSDSLNVRALIDYERDLSLVKHSEEEERARRILEFNNVDLDTPAHLSEIVREQKSCIFAQMHNIV